MKLKWFTKQLIDIDLSNIRTEVEDMICAFFSGNMARPRRLNYKEYHAFVERVIATVAHQLIHVGHPSDYAKINWNALSIIAEVGALVK